MSKVTHGGKSAMINSKLLLAFVGLLTLLSSRVFAYSFAPTEAEFRTWPAYCKVVYVRTEVGKRTSFSSLITQSELVAGSAVLASAPPYGEGGVHHFCVGKSSPA